MLSSKFIQVFIVIVHFVLIHPMNVKADTSDTIPPIPTITLKNLWMRPTLGELKMSTLYLTMASTLAETDYLLTIKSEIADYVGIEKTIVEDNIASLIDVKKIAIPANNSVEFAPGQIHVILLGVKKNLRPGDKVKFDFTFEKLGTMSAEAIVSDSKPH
jgi:copper(I)-binding protein